MEKEISLSAGLKLTPYSDVSPDGELALCHGLEVDGTSLRPSVVDGTTTELAAKLLYVHETYTYKHYILIDGTTLKWQDDGATTATALDEGSIGEVKLTSVGNVLIGTTDDTMYYWLWNQQNTYVFLGHRIPELPIQFGLEHAGYVQDRDHLTACCSWTTANLTQSGYAAIETYSFVTGDEESDVTVTDEETWSASVMTALNEKLNDIAGNDKFALPFYVRAAFETYDGNYVSLTPPVLMQPNTQGIRIPLELENPIGTKRSGYAQMILNMFQLTYRWANGYSTLDKWKDILKKITIFVTPAFRCWNEDGVITYIRNSTQNTLPRPGESRRPGTYTLPDDYGFWKKQNTSTVTYTYERQSNIVTDQVELVLEYKDVDDDLNDYWDEMKDESRFIKLASIELPSATLVKDQWSTVTIEKGNVTSLEARAEGDSLKETYSNGHYQIGANSQFVYNNRLNLSCVNLDIADNIPSWSQFPPMTNAGATSQVNVVVTLKKGGRTYVVKNDDSQYLMDPATHSIYWFFFPDPDATHVLIWTSKNSEGKYKYLDVDLTEHTYLNGAYWFSKFVDCMVETDTMVIPALSSDTNYQQNNMLYTSEVSNPFLFPLAGQNTIGTGEILAVTAITTPLSQGQFGQYPMIALCSDGNYSLEIGSTGLITSIRPMVRDVCVNKDNVVPIDNALLYVSQRGLVVMSGNEVQCISQELEGVVDSMAQELLKPDGSTASSQHRAPGKNQTVISGLTSEGVLLNDGTTPIGTLSVVKDNEYKMTFDMSAAEITQRYTITVKVGNQTLYSGDGGTSSWSITWIAEETIADAAIYVSCSHTTTTDRSGNVTKNFTLGAEIKLTIYYPSATGSSTDAEDEEEETSQFENLYTYDGLTYQKKTEQTSYVSYDFYDLDPRTFISLCQCVWDYTNQRIILVAKGVDKGYVRNMKTGTWSTIPLRDTVQAVMNKYPYSYIQWADNTLTQLDATYPYDPTQVETGIILTRPLKLDSLQMKKVCEFAIQGILDGSSRVQTITLYGSNDGVNWTEIGTTTRQRVPHVPGRWYKYWRFKIETNLSQAENISGIRMRYDVRGETRIR